MKSVRRLPLRSIDRARVLAYRAAAQGLHRGVGDVARLTILDLGVQDSPPGSANQALAVRLPPSPGDPVATPGLVTTWSVRGAPHVHRDEGLIDLSRALWPWSDEDALARLDTSAAPVRRAGLAARDALRLVAEHIADIVDEPMPKGEVSTALTPRIPPEMTVDCRSCQATHVTETVFRAAVLPAGIVFAPRERVVTFVPVDGWPGVPDDNEGVERLVVGYLGILGPATAREVASFLGTKTKELEPRWPDGLAEVDVDGEIRWMPEEMVDDLADPLEQPEVRLLPPSDPWLQARDRDLIVPDRERQRALWPILGRPGAVLVRGEVEGTWRARKKGRRLHLTVQPFGRLSASTRRLVEEEAQIIARARGTAEAAVTLE